jgi:hypothetical protein
VERTTGVHGQLLVGEFEVHDVHQTSRLNHFRISRAAFFGGPRKTAPVQRLNRGGIESESARECPNSRMF